MDWYFVLSRAIPFLSSLLCVALVQLLDKKIRGVCFILVIVFMIPLMSRCTYVNDGSIAVLEMSFWASILILGFSYFRGSF